MVIGDFNAKLDRVDTKPATNGKHSSHMKSSNNGVRLLHILVITNTPTTEKQNLRKAPLQQYHGREDP